MVVAFTLIKKLYCFVCKLFAFDSEKIMLASVGYGDWKQAPRDLARHESSNKHLSYLSTYISRRAKKSICKDSEDQKEKRETCKRKRKLEFTFTGYRYCNFCVNAEVSNWGVGTHWCVVWKK